MGKNWPAIIFLLAVTSLISGQSNTQSVGTSGIAGTVLNEEGQLVDHSNVCTQVTSGSRRIISCGVFTDKDGRFQIENVKFGNYEVFATKEEEEGYSIDNQAPGQRVTITPDNPWANVTVRLRSKGGILIGSVRNKTSGHPVKEISAQYIAIDRKDVSGFAGFSTADGDFRMIAPDRM